MHPYSILIADDCEINRIVLKSQLEVYFNDLTFVEDGKAALDCLNAHKYELILLDIHMPFFSGFDLIKLIRRENSINCHAPVIAISAFFQNTQRKKVIDAGFDECLDKPISVEQIQEILDLWIPSTSLPLYSRNTQNYSNEYLKTMLNITSGNKVLAADLFNKLFDELQEQLTAIQSAIDSNELPLANHITHKLHGSVSFCGFTDLQKLANELEKKLSETNHPSIQPCFLALQKKIISFVNLKEEILQQL